MTQRILKYILVAVVIGIIGYGGFIAYEEFTQTASANMSEAVQLSQAQAQNVNQALGEVSAIGTAGQQPINRPSSQPANQAPLQATNRTPSQPQIVEPPDIAMVSDLDTLLAQWRPRYNTAKIAHAKFEASINNAKIYAGEYFAQQRAITGQIRDPQNRANAEREDEHEAELYMQWEEKANTALMMADGIILRLDDMDANFRKMELRADLVFDTSAFLEAPEAIYNLNQQLADFQIASENIKAMTGPAFQPR